MGKDIINVSLEKGRIVEIALERLEEKEEEVEGRIEKLEKIENNLVTRIQRIERRLGLKSERMGPRKEEVSLREIISEEMKAIRKTTPKMSGGKRRRILKEEMKDILKEHDGREREEISEGEKEQGKKERKVLLRKEIEGIISSKNVREGEEKEPAKGIKEKDVSTDQDARLLFKIVLREGSVKLDEARGQLGVDEKIMQEWIDDLEGAGVIKVVKTAYGQEARLKTVGFKRENNGGL